MEKETNTSSAIKAGIDIEKIFAYLGIISLLITFWQGWRDIHKDISDLRAEIKERVVSLEIKVEKLEEK